MSPDSSAMFVSLNAVVILYPHILSADQWSWVLGSFGSSMVLAKLMPALLADADAVTSFCPIPTEYSSLMCPAENPGIV